MPSQQGIALDAPTLLALREIIQKEVPAAMEPVRKANKEAAQKEQRRRSGTPAREPTAGNEMATAKEGPRRRSPARKTGAAGQAPTTRDAGITESALLATIAELQDTIRGLRLEIASLCKPGAKQTHEHKA